VSRLTSREGIIFCEFGRERLDLALGDHPFELCTTHLKTSRSLTQARTRTDSSGRSWRRVAVDVAIGGAEDAILQLCAP